MKLLASLMLVATLMSSTQISGIVTKKAAQGATPQTLWNLGFEFYYQHGFSQKEMAANLAEGYKSAAGVSDEQKAVIEYAAKFWQTMYKNWDTGKKPRANIPGANWDPRRNIAPGFFQTIDPLQMNKAPRYK